MERSIKETRENRDRRAQQGFTLLEILVVVLIIGTIASLVTVKVLDRLEQAKHSAAMIQMNSFKQALDLFRLDNGFYPETEQGLRALVGAPEVGRQPRNYRPEGYLNAKEVPLDPWGSPYMYLSDGTAFQIWSVGPDGQNATQDDIQS